MVCLATSLDTLSGARRLARSVAHSRTLPDRYQHGHPVNRLVRGVLPGMHCVALYHGIARMQCGLLFVEHQDQFTTQQEIDVDRLGTMPKQLGIWACRGKGDEHEVGTPTSGSS